MRCLRGTPLGAGRVLPDDVDLLPGVAAEAILGQLARGLGLRAGRVVVGVVLAGEGGADADDHDERRDPRQHHAAAAAVGEICETGEMTGHQGGAPFLALPELDPAGFCSPVPGSPMRRTAGLRYGYPHEPGLRTGRRRCVRSARRDHRRSAGRTSRPRRRPGTGPPARPATGRTRRGRRPRRPGRRGSLRAPRPRGVAARRASVRDHAASLISSRSCSSAFAAIIAWRRREWSRSSPMTSTAAPSAAATAPSGGAAAGAAASAATRRSLEPVGAGEQHLALVGEVAEERPRGQPGALGDLGHGGLLVAALEEQLHRGLRAGGHVRPAPIAPCRQHSDDTA